MMQWTMCWMLTLALTAISTPGAWSRNITRKSNTKSYTYEGRVYEYHSEPLDWYSSLKLCMKKRMYLSIVSTEVEEDDILEIMKKEHVDKIHAGYHDVHSEGDFVNILGETLDRRETDWCAGYPWGGRKWNCGGFSDVGYVDLDCEEERTYVCSKKPKTYIQKPPPGYRLIKGHGYYIHNQWMVPWMEAEELCRLDGAHLVVLNSQDEADKIKANFALEEEELYGYWVDVQRFLGESQFLTALGGTLDDTGYSWWMPGEPEGTAATHPVVGYSIDPVNFGLASFKLDTTGPICICEYNHS